MTDADQKAWRFNLLWIAILLLPWAAVTFGATYFSRDLHWTFLGWPLGFWVAAQGALVVYWLIVWLYGRVMNRREANALLPATPVADATGVGHSRPDRNTSVDQVAD